MTGAAARTMPGTTPRNGLPQVKPYVYRGTGADILTPSFQGGVRVPGSRQQRLGRLASMRLWDGGYPVPAGFLTAQQAADELGVTVRTVERYKRELRAMGGAS